MVVMPMRVPTRHLAALGATLLFVFAAVARAQVDKPLDTQIDPARALQAAFSSTAAAVQPSVVGIIASRPPTARDQGPPEPEVSTGNPGLQHRLGAGFLIDSDGWVITSTPLVMDSEHVEVISQEGSILPVLAVHYDRASGVAALRVKLGTADVPPVVFPGEDDGLTEPGQWAIVVGPRIYGMTISSVGHVTAPLLRVASSARGQWSPIRTLLFTSVPRVPMGEGAPVVDLDGRVIGMALPAKEAANLDDIADVMVAVTADEVQAVFERIRSGGTVARPWMGVQLQDIPPEVRASLGAPNGGVHLVRLVSRGPMAAAGAHVGDILVQLRSLDESGAEPVRITELADLSPVLDRSKPGDGYRLTLLREGQPVELDITLGEFPDPAGKQPVAPADGNRGLAVRPATPEELRGFQADHGLLIEDVEAGLSAFLPGLRAGDLLLQVGDTRLHTPADLSAALEATHPGVPVGIAFRRLDEGGLASFLAVGQP